MSKQGQIKEMRRYVLSDLEPEETKAQEMDSSQEEAPEDADERETPPANNIILPAPE